MAEGCVRSRAEENEYYGEGGTYDHLDEVREEDRPDEEEPTVREVMDFRERAAGVTRWHQEDDHVGGLELSRSPSGFPTTSPSKTWTRPGVPSKTCGADVDGIQPIPGDEQREILGENGVTSPDRDEARAL